MNACKLKRNINANNWKSRLQIFLSADPLFTNNTLTLPHRRVCLAVKALPCYTPLQSNIRIVIINQLNASTAGYNSTLVFAFYFRPEQHSSSWNGSQWVRLRSSFHQLGGLPLLRNASSRNLHPITFLVHRLSLTLAR